MKKIIVILLYLAVAFFSIYMAVGYSMDVRESGVSARVNNSGYVIARMVNSQESLGLQNSSVNVVYLGVIRPELVSGVVAVFGYEFSGNVIKYVVLPVGEELKVVDYIPFLILFGMFVVFFALVLLVKNDRYRLLIYFGYTVLGITLYYFYQQYLLLIGEVVIILFIFGVMKYGQKYVNNQKI